MIFGEYLGEVVSNGEYEIRASGTTVADLKAAIDVLSKEEFLDSLLILNTDGTGLISNDCICRPWIGEVKSYLFIAPQNSNQINAALYYLSGHVYNTVKTIANGAVSRTQRSDIGTGDLLLIINSWKLYVRKAVLAIPGEGNIAHIIAPVQKTLTAIKAYSKDDQFVYNDDLYKATTSIALGGTITIGTNAVRASSITEQIGNLLGSNGIYYNANTDITVATNRGMAIKYICDNMDKKIYIATYSIRYANGYYCMYVVNRLLLGGTTRYVVIEYPITGQPSNVKICFWQYIPSTAPTTPDWTI